jgi:hypothetical protein
MEGNVMEMPLNPAGFTAFEDAVSVKLGWYFNPWGAGLAVRNSLQSTQTLEARDYYFPLLLAFKGISVSYNALNAGLIFLEQFPEGRQQEVVYDYFPLYEEYYNRAVVKLSLSKRAVVGVSAEMYSSRNGIEDVGYSYGLILKPGKLNVGVFYRSAPGDYRGEFLQNLRLANETINAGLSWAILEKMKWFIDLRNISEEGSPAFMEPHTGIEITPWEHLALRGGYYSIHDEGNTFSGGIGLCNLNEFWSLSDRSETREFLLDYAIVFAPDESIIHSLALHFRL